MLNKNSLFKETYRRKNSFMLTGRFMYFNITLRNMVPGKHGGWNSKKRAYILNNSERGRREEGINRKRTSAHRH